MSLDLQNIIKDVLNKNVVIPKQYEVILDDLKKAEGGYLHYNSKEVDITTGYGIYKAKHPGALVFKYIESLATDINSNPTNTWKDQATLKKIDNRINPEVERYLSYLFYKDFLAGARIELFDPSNVILVTNLYTNSPKGCWMSIQEGLRDMQKDGILKIPLDKLSGVDGLFGDVTRKALIAFSEIVTETEYEKVLINKLFRKSVLLAMKTYYTKLIAGDPSKHLINAKGWDNRMEELEHK